MSMWMPSMMQYVVVLAPAAHLREAPSIFDVEHVSDNGGLCTTARVCSASRGVRDSRFLSDKLALATT